MKSFIKYLQTFLIALTISIIDISLLFANQNNANNGNNSGVEGIQSIDQYISNALGLGFWTVLTVMILVGMIAVAMGITKMWNTDDQRERDKGKNMIGWGLVAFMFAFMVIGAKKFLVGDAQISKKEIFSPIGENASPTMFKPF